MQQDHQGQDNKSWQEVISSTEFRELVLRKRNFIVPTVIIFSLFYMTLPILTGFTTLLNGNAIGAITWAWLYAYATIPVTWLVCHLYLSQAAKWDEISKLVYKQSHDEKESE